MIEQVLRQLDSLQRELTRINPLHNNAADQVAAMASTLRTTAALMAVEQAPAGEQIVVPRAA